MNEASPASAPALPSMDRIFRALPADADTDPAAWPLVSVLVPTYNQQAFVAEALDSVLAQGYPRLQVVVSDDASTDGTPGILRAYARRHPGVVELVEQPVNLGVTRNCNAVLERCTGKYVALFAGDDIMLPGKLHAQVRLMEAHPDCALSYHNLEIFDSGTGRTLRLYNRRPGERFAGRMRFPPREGGAELLVRYGTFVGGCSIMARREWCPPGYDERVRVASDWLFFIETALRGRILYIPDVLGRYRRHGHNVTHVSGSLGEELLTLDIVDEQYPHLRPFSAGYRRNHYLRRAARRVQARDARGALAALRQAVSWARGRAPHVPPPPRPLPLPRLTDARGGLSFLQQGTHVPFEIGDVRWRVGAAAGEALEGELPADGPSFLVPLAGAFRVETDGSPPGRGVTLAFPAQALPLSGGARVHAAAPDGVLLALSPAGPSPAAPIPARPDAPAAGALPRVEDCRILTLPSRHVGSAREVRAVPGPDVPFPVRRVYYLYGMPAGGTRGQHAHRDLQQLIVCVAGALDVVLRDGAGERTVRLEAPDQGLHVPRMLWRELVNAAPGTVCMVLASAPYDEADYIRSYDEFLACRAAAPA